MIGRANSRAVCVCVCQMLRNFTQKDMCEEERFVTLREGAPYSSLTRVRRIGHTEEGVECEIPALVHCVCDLF